MTSTNQTRLVAGCMTGTSIDSLDAALVEVSGRGLLMHARFLRAVTHELGPLKPRLRALADQHPVTAAEIAALAHDFALLHARALKELCSGATPAVACIHGQTVYHKPPLSWQLMQPAPVAHALGCPVVYDLRSADLAAGGQGAPITPIADLILFGSPTHPRDVVNLGGFCNITHLPARAGEDPAAHIRGRDVCACNQVLDAVSRATTGNPYDEGGRLACRGIPSHPHLERLSGLLSHQSRSGRSLGTGDELHAWIEQARHELSPETIAATACEALGQTIAAQLAAPAVVAGGGVRNAALLQALKRHARHEVSLSDDLGIPAPHREAACFAILGALCQDRIPITLPQVTHVPAPAPISGHWILP
jgi:1,6-anhydro-N-acetylmuramate kinase